MNKTLKALACLIVLALIFVGGLCIINAIECHEETVRYNNGTCIECGIGHLIPTDSWFDRASGNTFHGFTCDHCNEKYAFKFFGEN